MKVRSALRYVGDNKSSCMLSYYWRAPGGISLIMISLYLVISEFCIIRPANCQVLIDKHNMTESPTSRVNMTQSINEKFQFTNHRMDPNEVPKLIEDGATSSQNNLAFNVDFLERPDQFEAGQSFFMPSKQMPFITYKEAPTAHSRLFSDEAKWSIAYNQPEQIQQLAIQMKQNPIPQTLGKQSPQVKVNNQAAPSLIFFDDDNDYRNSTSHHSERSVNHHQGTLDELVRLKEAERILEDNLALQRKLLSLLNDKRDISIDGQQHHNVTDNNVQDNLYPLRQSDGVTRNLVPTGQIAAQHPKHRFNIKQELSLTKQLPSSQRLSDERTPIKSHLMIAQSTTTLPMVKIKPNVREESMQMVNDDEIQVQQSPHIHNDRLLAQSSPPVYSTKLQLRPELPTTSSLQLTSPAQRTRGSTGIKQRYIYSNKLKQFDSLDKSESFNSKERRRGSTPQWSTAFNTVDSSIKDDTSEDSDDDNSSYSTPFPARHQDWRSTSIGLEDAYSALYDGDMSDHHNGPNQNRLPVATSNNQLSHDWPPAGELRPAPINMQYPRQQWPPRGGPVIKPAQLNPINANAYTGLAAPSHYTWHHRYPMPINAYAHKMEASPSTGALYYQRYGGRRPTGPGDDYIDAGGSHSHKIIHIHTNEKKKYGKYLWPILGGGLTMLMGFLIISNMLLSIPLLAIGASSLFNHGGFHTQQLVPVYNLSQLSPRPSGRRRKRWAPVSLTNSTSDVIEPRELLKRVLLSLANGNRCRARPMVF